VPLPNKTASDVVSGHHRYSPNTLSGSLRGTIIARSPVHVASGLLEQKQDRKYPLVKAHFRSGGHPTIPGTSLKGCIRSIVEAITCSSVQIMRRDHKIPRQTKESLKAYQPASVKSGKKVQQNKLDPAQRIFGAMGYQGLVCFRDAVLQRGDMITVPTPQLHGPNPGAIGAYFEDGKLCGRKFYMHGSLAEGNLPLEACDAGSIFSFHMDFENLSREELGVVLIALGLSEGDEPSFCPKLGGGKPACLGTIALLREELRLEAWDAQAAYTAFDTPSQAVDLASLIAAGRESNLVLKDQLQELVKILRYPPEDERACPSGTY
jgi:CRISPR/Cas system CSM-associated protein Csm3 (group 7 of RAMP superfamily)